MRRFVTKLVVPIVSLFIMVGITCNMYANVLREKATQDELSILADDLTYRLFSADMIIKTVMDYHDHASVVAGNLNFYTNRKEIEAQLASITQTENVVISFVCDGEGEGYNYKGEQLSVKNDDFFEIAKNTFSRGGNGFIAIDNNRFSKDKAVAVVHQVDFKDQVSGYFITFISVSNLAEMVFRYMPYIDNAYIASLGGDVIVEKGSANGFTENIQSNLWDSTQNVLPVDTIKLNISQKKKFMDKVEGYGYLIMAPSEVTQGAAIAMINEKGFEHEIHYKLAGYRRFVVALYTVLVIFVLVMLIFNFADKQLRLRLSSKWLRENNTDKLTGLFNRQGMIEQIDQYIASANDKKGIIFVMTMEGFSKFRQDTSDGLADAAIKDFIGKLTEIFRASDMVGRLSDDEYMVFLKDIAEDKDVRKQVDELQMFLYDIKNDEAEKGISLKPYVGAAIFPKDGGNSEQLVTCAEKALDEAKLEGRGRILFYK